MKFMKLGSKTDLFQSDGSNVRFVASELPTDVIVHVDEVKFYLHKFPLLFKSGRLQNLVLKASEGSTDEVFMHDFPGGPIAFEICAKFCYGMVVTLNAYNVIAVRCAAEYLEMTEDVEKGNLIFKIDIFLNSSIFRSWKDSIIVLKTTKAFLPWSEELKLVGRCIDRIASRTSIDPTNVNWSYNYSKKLETSDEIVETQQALQTVPKDWWIEDLCELDVDLYKRVMAAIKSKGRMPSDIIGEALRAYAVRWLPDSYDALVADEYTKRNRVLIETIIDLLPSDRCSRCSCRFLLKLLKVVILVGAGSQLKEELMNRISLQLHKASVKDLLIPAKTIADTIYDVSLVQTLVDKFMLQICKSHDTGTDKKGNNNCHEITTNDSLLTMGNLVDGYLAEVAIDPNLPTSSFIDLTKSVPETARPVHDALYTAIDIYLKEHPYLSKDEKKRICGLMNVKKLSADASIHAAQNNRLPLRMVVQVLFFEQLREAAGRAEAPTKGISHDSSVSRAKLKDECNFRQLEHPNSQKQQLGSLKIINEFSNSTKEKGHELLRPSRSRRIFDKLLWSGKGHGETNRSSETSRSSQSPPTSLKPLENKASVSSSRNRRYSIS